MDRILKCIRDEKRITLPVFNPELARPNDHFALINIGLEPNDFSGSLGDFRYQFEGEEDLLHLIVTRSNQSTLTTEEARVVADFVLIGMPSALVWLRPGEYSQHFYFGHDELLKNIVP